MKKPTLDEVEEYCRSRNNGIHPCAFFDYYDSVGWLIGKKPMKDWQAAVRTWERKRREGRQQSVLVNLADRSWADNG